LTRYELIPERKPEYDLYDTLPWTLSSLDESEQKYLRHSPKGFPGLGLNLYNRSEEITSVLQRR